MERLTAFEFIAAERGVPQQLRLSRKDGTVINEFFFVDWFAVDLGLAPWEFEARDDLIIENQNGLARPYWNDEVPFWTVAFNPVDIARHVETIRAAVIREVRRLQVALN